MKSWSLALGAVVVLAGCLGEDEAEAKGSTTCDPDTFAFLIGQDKSALDGVTVPEMVRVLGVNSAATTDYHENRLNVIHDEDGKILSVNCG